MSYVFDASSLLNLTRELAEKVLDLLKENFTVSLAVYEIGNTLWKECSLRERLSVEEATKILGFAHSMLGLMNVIHVKEVDLGAKMLTAAIRLNITYYDVAYLCVAEELDKVLITDDEKLREAAERIKVKALSSKNLIESGTT